MELTTKTLKNLADLTAINAHGYAYELGAKSLGLTELQTTFVRINNECERVGSLPYPLSLERQGAYEKLMEQAQAVLTEEQFKAFYQCF